MYLQPLLRNFALFNWIWYTCVTGNDLWRNLCKSLLYFLVRLQCRRKESSRSLSHLLMSFFCIILSYDFFVRQEYLFFPLLIHIIFSVYVRYMSPSVRLSVVCNVRAPFRITWFTYKRILTFTVTMSWSVRLSVCRLSVTFVHPTQSIEIFGNISTTCGTGTLAIHDLCITRNSSGDDVANVNFLCDDIVHALKNTIDSCINSATHRFQQRRFTKFSEIMQCNGHYAVQGHSRLPILVPIESSYTTSY